MLSSLLLTIVAISAVVTAKQVGCGDDAALPVDQFQPIIKKLSNATSDCDKLTTVTTWTQSQTIGISGNETVQLLLEFTKSNNDVTLYEAIVVVAPKALGLTSAQVASVLQHVKQPIVRLEAFRLMVNTAFDLRTNNATLLALFKPSNKAIQQEAATIVEHAKPINCVWGPPDGEQNIVLVVDVSGTMIFPFGSTTRIQMVKQQTITFLKELNATQKFNVFIYADNTVAWKSSSVAATPANVASAITFIDGIIVNGRTYMLKALQTAMDSDSSIDQITLLSDGEPNDSESGIVNLAKKWVAKTSDHRRVNTVFVGGDQAAEDFMRDVAAAGKGQFRSLSS